MSAWISVGTRGSARDPVRGGRLGLGAGIVLLGLGLSGCTGFNNVGHEVAIVRDLSQVAGCEFRGTVAPPRTTPGLRVASAYADYLAELRRRTAALGGTHLYMLNEAAGWGAASALGTAYRCRT